MIYPSMHEPPIWISESGIQHFQPPVHGKPEHRHYVRQCGRNQQGVDVITTKQEYDGWKRDDRRAGRDGRCPYPVNPHEPNGARNEHHRYGVGGRFAPHQHPILCFGAYYSTHAMWWYCMTTPKNREKICMTKIHSLGVQLSSSLTTHKKNIQLDIYQQNYCGTHTHQSQHVLAVLGITCSHHHLLSHITII